MANVLEKHGFKNVLSVVCDDVAAGKAMANDPRVPLVSFTGSTEIGRIVSTNVHGRFGKAILELGGNNAQIVMGDCDIDMALTATCFGAVGTSGQRCTSLRRVLVQDSIYDSFIERLTKAYAKLETRMGDPLDDNTLVGPLHSTGSVDNYLKGIENIKA